MSINSKISLCLGITLMCAATAPYALECDFYYDGFETHPADCERIVSGDEISFTRSTGLPVVVGFRSFKLKKQPDAKSYTVTGELKNGSIVDLGQAVPGIYPECIGGYDFLVCMKDEIASNKPKSRIIDEKCVINLEDYVNYFTELMMNDFKTANLSAGEEIGFVLGQSFNHKRSLLTKHVPSNTCPKGDWMMSLQNVLHGVANFFGKQYAPDGPEINSKYDYYCFDGDNFHFIELPEMNKLFSNEASVVYAAEQEGEHIVLSGWMFNDYNDKKSLGTFQARVKRVIGLGGEHNFIVEYIKPFMDSPKTNKKPFEKVFKEQVTKTKYHSFKRK